MLINVGASLVLATVKVKVLVATRPDLSLAMTLMLIAPTSLLVGVPLKVRVAASKVNQVGKGLPFSKVAE